MPTVVTLPNYFNYGTLYSFTAAVVRFDGFPADKEFTFDFGRLTFIDGSGLTVLCNTLEWLYSHGVKVWFDNHARPQSASIAYLDDCGFFERHTGSRLRSTASIRNSTLPFTKVAHADAHGWLEYNFTPWMSGVLGVSHGALGSVRTCIKEVFNNILDHSTQNIGFVHVQHYPNKQNVKVTVSDFGRGIPSNIRVHYPDLTDAAAILKATEPGFTTKSTPRNMGVGLDFLIESVTGNQGSVSIYSFMGALHCNRDGANAPRRIPVLGNGSYPGTLVEISLRTDCFVGDDEDEEEMTW